MSKKRKDHYPIGLLILQPPGDKSPIERELPGEWKRLDNKTKDPCVKKTSDSTNNAIIWERIK